MNKFIGIGRLTRDAELSYIASTGTPKVVYTIAIDRAYQKDKNNKKTDFINCEQIGKHCENLCKYLTKGKLISIEGELNIDQYEKDGEKRSFTKIKVDRLEFLSGSNSNNENNNIQTVEGFQAINDDDIPF